MLEVADGGAFAQELRVGHDRNVGVRPSFADDALDLVAGADRHRRLGDHHGKAVERGGDLARGVIDEAQIGVAVAAARRRADRDEHRVGVFHRRRRVGGEFQPPGARIGGDHGRQGPARRSASRRARAPRSCRRPCRRRSRRGRNRQSRPRKRARHSRCRSWQRAWLNPSATKVNLYGESRWRLHSRADIEWREPPANANFLRSHKDVRNGFLT